MFLHASEDAIKYYVQYIAEHSSVLNSMTKTNTQNFISSLLFLFTSTRRSNTNDFNHPTSCSLSFALNFLKTQCLLTRSCPDFRHRVELPIFTESIHSQGLYYISEISREDRAFLYAILCGLVIMKKEKKLILFNYIITLFNVIDFTHCR